MAEWAWLAVMIIAGVLAIAFALATMGILNDAYDELDFFVGFVTFTIACGMVFLACYSDSRISDAPERNEVTVNVGR